MPALLLKIRPALGRPLNFDYFDGSIDYAKIIVSMSDWRPAKTLPVALSFEVYHSFSYIPTANTLFMSEIIPIGTSVPFEGQLAKSPKSRCTYSADRR